jgi:hypothetical protein
MRDAVSPFGSLIFSAIVGSFAAIAVVMEITGLRVLFVQSRKQVPRRWLGWPRRGVAAACYGFVLGLTIFTKIHRPVTYSLLACILLAPSIASGTLVGASLGGSRGIALIVAWVVQWRLAARLEGLRVRSYERAMLTAAGAVASAVAVTSTIAL